MRGNNIFISSKNNGIIGLGLSVEAFVHGKKHKRIEGIGYEKFL